MAILEQESDESLMVRVQSHDHQAFAVLVRRHSERFYATAYRVCAEQMMAEDIVQEAFLKLWAKPGSWQSGKGAKFTTWFYRVVHNLTLDHMRRKKPQASPDVLDYTADERPGQDESLVQDEEKKLIEAAVQALPERQKLALNLCFYEGLSNKEAADIMGVGVKALESLLMRAKAGLRDELTRQGIIDREEKYG